MEKSGEKTADVKLMLTEVTFDPAAGGGTALRLMQSPIDASAEEQALYAQMAPNMVTGWTMGFEMIDGLLSASPD